MKHLDFQIGIVTCLGSSRVGSYSKGGLFEGGANSRIQGKSPFYSFQG